MRDGYVAITKRFRFEAAHRLKDHAGKCRNLHGHSYTVTVEARKVSGIVDEDGMVMDFGDFKPLEKWIDRNLDHACILQASDVELTEPIMALGLKKHLTEDPPTAETLAAEIHGAAAALFEGRLRILRVEVRETVGCAASVQ